MPDNQTDEQLTLKERKDRYMKKWYFRIRLKNRRRVHALMLPVIRIKMRMGGYKVHVLGEKEIQTPERPVIFALNHNGKMDIEAVAGVIREQYFLLTSDFKELVKHLEGFVLAFTGVIYVDPFDRQDSRKAKEIMADILHEGGNIMWYPEGEWNLSPNVLVQPLFWGMAEVVHKTGARVIPIGVQVFGKNYWIKIGAPSTMGKHLAGDNSLTPENKQEAMNQLREELATLVWDILETQPIYARSSVPAGEHDDYIKSRLIEWPANTQEKIERYYLPNRLGQKQAAVMTGQPS